MTEQAIRICLDINVLVSDLLGTLEGKKGTASRYLVDAVRNGECEAGPVQFITSVPVIENWAAVLIKKFKYDRESSEETAWLLHDYATEGPLAIPPSIVVGAGHVPFATEQDERKAAQAHLTASEEKLYDEIADDRHVLLSAIGGQADLLISNDVDDFYRGPAQAFSNRADAITYPRVAPPLVIGKPSFVAYWLRQGIVPDASFIASRPEEFVTQSAASTPGKK